MSNPYFSKPILFITGLLLSACTVPGQRAADVDGACPEGETCSDLTPEGLFFSGSTASDSVFGAGLLPTAVGGKQTMTALSGEVDERPPFEGDFDAKTADPSVATVDAVDPPSIVVRGGAKGTSFLRLLEPGTAKLLDRVEIQVEPIDHIKVLPRELVLDESETGALLAGSSVPLVVRLFGAGEKRLADETIELSPASGEAAGKAWDLFEVTAPPSGEASFEIKAGGGSFTATAQVVSAIDGITPVFGDEMTPESLPVSLDDDSILCFMARSGATAVAGATWAFKPSEGVKVSDEAAQVLSLSNLPNCVNLHGMTAGKATLEVTAGGLAKTFQLTVSKMAMKALHREPLGRRLAPRRPIGAPSAGERARGTGGF
jgi:hypothetical protein